MENDIFIAQPFLPPNDSAPVTNSVVSCSAGLKHCKLDERHSSKNDGDRVLARIYRVTTVEAAQNEPLTPNENKSGLAIGKRKTGTFDRSKRNLIEPHSSKNGGERAFASSSHPFTNTKEGKIAESTWRPQKVPLTPSIDGNVTSSARHLQEMSNELRSSKIDGERAAASPPHTSPFSKKGKIADSQHQLPQSNSTTQGHISIAAGAMFLIVIFFELCSSKSDRELASARTLSNELIFHGVSSLPLSECQPGCHYKSSLLQARNHVRWRGLI